MPCSNARNLWSPFFSLWLDLNPSCLQHAKVTITWERRRIDSTNAPITTTVSISLRSELAFKNRSLVLRPDSWQQKKAFSSQLGLLSSKEQLSVAELLKGRFNRQRRCWRLQCWPYYGCQFQFMDVLFWWRLSTIFAAITENKYGCWTMVFKV